MMIFKERTIISCFSQFSILVKSLQTTIFIITLISIKASSISAEFSGCVVRIIDGDTLDVLMKDKNKYSIRRVRLAQIDAPEKKQAFGKRARQTLASLIFQKDITIIQTGTDRYGRIVGNIYINTLNINNELVHRGMAWAYRYYITDSTIIKIEAKARKEKRGLWIDSSPIPPWEFRKELRLGSKKKRNTLNY